MKKILPLFIFILIMSFSTCFARTTIDEKEASYIWNYLVTTQYSDSLDNGEYVNLYRYPSSTLVGFERRDLDYSQEFMTFFNNNNTIDFDLNNLFFICYTEDWGQNRTMFHITYGVFNDGNDDSLPFLAFRFPSDVNTGTLTINTVDANKNNINSTTQYIHFCIQADSSVTFSNMGISTSNSIGSGLKTRFSNWNENNYSTILNCIPGVVSFNSNNFICSNWDGNTISSSLSFYKLSSLFDSSNNESNNPSNSIFNGIIESYENVYGTSVDPIGTCISNDNELRFRYSTNFDYDSGETGKIIVWLEELTPFDAITQTSTHVDNPYSGDNFYRLATSSTNRPFAYNLKYQDILSYMKTGNIYRLHFYFFKNYSYSVSYQLANGSTGNPILSGDQMIFYDISTSEFFSKESYSSDKIIVKNIYKLIKDVNNSSLIYSGENGIISKSGDSGDSVSQGLNNISNSLVDLNKGFNDGLNNLNTNIENSILGTPNESGERSGGLLGGLLDGLKGLFIPEDGYFETWFNKLLGYINDKLGFLGEIITFIPNLMQNLIDLCGSIIEEYHITIPDIDVPDFQGHEITVLQGFDVDVYGLIHQNEQMSELYILYLNLIDFFVFLALINYGWSVVCDIFDIDFMPDDEPKSRPIGYGRD